MMRERGRWNQVLATSGAALLILAAMAVGGLPVVVTAKSKDAEPANPPAPPALPKIVRVVCTDHICGHCDGKCHKDSGHVALDKKGHCACTPTEGSPLDQATRDAYEKSQPQ